MDPKEFVSHSLARIRNGRWVMSVGVLLWIVLPSIVTVSCAVAGVRAGVEIGLNYSSLHYYHLDQIPEIFWDPGWRPSFTGGVTLQVPIRGRFDLVTGLRYVQQGNRVKFNAPPLVGEFRVYQDYLSMPALLTYYPMKSHRLFFSLGPEIGLLISAHSVMEFSKPISSSQSTNDKDRLESTNVTVDASTGYEFPVENHVGVVSLRYTHGLTDAAKREDWNTGWETRGVELLLGMRW
jgi:hypothetical protein